ncbi:hypothetical protein C9374_003564 [Naegleria lovaniensis]|uniref:Cilia- and flagella-associated protein 263 n=1 Tax=Naegleria lovaniensis TaxID=51637 RepID=A0AA88GZH7_NAELO|nr:uncharacterized protein C9374_003564 [Naegleria lovaniensis]KAG2393800.1 hypothetical protein C9374_003564 [Naegleria lovaniensis]
MPSSENMLGSSRETTPTHDYQDEDVAVMKSSSNSSPFVQPSPINISNNLSSPKNIASDEQNTTNNSSLNLGLKSNLMNNRENFSKYPDLPNFELYEFDEMEDVLERIIKENEFVEEELYIYEAFLKKMSERSGVPAASASNNEKDNHNTSSAFINTSNVRASTDTQNNSNLIQASQDKSKHESSKMNNQKSQQQLNNGGALTSESIQDVSGSLENRLVRKKSMDNISVSSFDDASDDASSVVSSGTTNTAGKKKKKRRQAVQEYQLTYENKIEIALKAIDILRNTIEKENKIYEKEIETMRARVQEADLEIEEVDKEHLEFRKEVVEPRDNGKNTKDGGLYSQYIAAEKIVQYFKNKQQQKDTLIHKLKLKISEIRAIVNKSKGQLESREQSGDQLTKTDFDQLKIENGLMNNKIDERNNELVELKLNTGALLQKLSALTEKLNKLTQDSKWYQKEIEKNRKDLESLKEEIEFVLKDKDIESGRNQKMVIQHEQVKVPEILTYIKMKAELDEVRKEVTNWQRKVEIQSMNESNTRKKLQGLLISNGNQRIASAGSSKSDSSLSGILTTNNQLSNKQLFK